MEKIISAFVTGRLLLMLDAGCTTFHPFGSLKLPAACLDICQRPGIPLTNISSP